MRLAAITAENIYRLITIETDRSRMFRVVDKRGPNAVYAPRVATFAEAQRAWSVYVAKILG